MTQNNFMKRRSEETTEPAGYVPEVFMKTKYGASQYNYEIKNEGYDPSHSPFRVENSKTKENFYVKQALVCFELSRF